MYSEKEILAFVEKIMDTYETTALEEMRAGRDFAEVYYRAMRGEGAARDMRDLMTKEVGRKFEYRGVCIEQYTDESGGIKIICSDDALMDRYCDDGVVFVALDNGIMRIIAHGRWEDILHDLSEG